MLILHNIPVPKRSNSTDLISALRLYTLVSAKDRLYFYRNIESSHPLFMK